LDKAELELLARSIKMWFTLPELCKARYVGDGIEAIETLFTTIQVMRPRWYIVYVFDFEVTVPRELAAYGFALVETL
jgi:hypothetical protein